MPLEFKPIASPPAVIEAVKNGEADIGFVAYEATRLGTVEFSQTYMLVRHSFLVLDGSPIKAIADIDRVGQKIAGTINDSITLCMKRILKQATIVELENNPADDDWLKKSELAVTFLDRYGNEVGSRGIRHNDAIPLDEFPDHLIKATLATEDRRFYEHFGIDIPGLFRAMLTNARAGGVVQGGSSISQQLAKNLFLSNERTIERKVKEAFLALWLEVRLPKNEILKLCDQARSDGRVASV